jgi:hypothetical protein
MSIAARRNLLLPPLTKEGLKEGKRRYLRMMRLLSFGVFFATNAHTKAKIDFTKTARIFFYFTLNGRELKVK